MKINKDEKVVDTLYNETQRLYTKLAFAYDDDLNFLGSLRDMVTDAEVIKLINDRIKVIQSALDSD